MRALKAVVYAKDARRIAGFYAALLGLVRQEEGTGFVRLVDAALELTVVQVPPALADTLVIDTPPAVREATPIKLFFAVAAIEALRELVAELGGGLQAADAGWCWLGERHLDGWDPEGNVFQLREHEA
jgi:predicted enzyme related to lactoylglutathione lyase